MVMETKKMTKIYDYDHETNEGVLRDATVEEIAELEIVSTNLEKLRDEESSNLAAKQAVLDKLGLSADEAALLLG